MKPTLPSSNPIVESAQEQGNVSVFDTADALAINHARMSHLESLGLDLAGRSVLDIGCGVGHLARFLIEKGCTVTCIDGRSENIAELKRRLPETPAYVFDMENSAALTTFGRFDVVLCYGLLYHLENPLLALRKMAQVCNEMLLLETVISDHELPILRIVEELCATANQALRGFGSRPTPSLVGLGLKEAGFEFIYRPLQPPSHPDFRFEYRNNLEWSRDGHLLRRIFVASRHALKNPALQLMPGSIEETAHACPPAMIGGAPRRVWVDVGSHLGEKTFAAAEGDPLLRVYAFEPNFRVACRSMGLLANFIIVPMAVAETNGSADFFLNKLPAASSLFQFVPAGLQQWIGRDDLEIERTIRVSTIRLDSFLNEMGISSVEFLKIDAQGADLSVIRSCGARLKDIERLSIEVQITPVPLYAGAATKGEVIAYLEEAGFELESVEQQSHGQEENLTFVRSAYETKEDAVAAARLFSFVYPLKPYPSWTFDAGWYNSDPIFEKRRRIWNYFKRRHPEIPLDFEWYDGLHITLFLGNDQSRALLVGGCVEPNEFALLDKFLQPGMFVIDAGANDGLHTLFCANRIGLAGHVFAFEPSSRELSRLRANLERNRLQNVTVHPIALSDRNGTALLHVASPEHAGQNTLGEFAYANTPLLTTETVAVRTLDSLLPDIQRLDLVKLDVEGAEVQVLSGATSLLRKHRPLVLFEALNPLYSQNSSRDELLQRLRDLGYALYAFDQQTGLPTPFREENYSDNMIAAPLENQLPPAWCAPPPPPPLDPASSPFALNEYELCASAAVDDEDYLTVITPAERWSYAVLFSARPDAVATLPPLRGIQLKLRGRVEAGSIGIGVVGSDRSTYVAPEVEHAASDKDVIFTVTVPKLPEGCSLVIRNTSSAGVVSKIIIRELRAFLSPA